MEDQKFQDDFRTYTGRHCIQGSIFYIYVLLGVSCLLSAIFLIVAVSKATSLSSELSTMNTERPKPKPGLDHELFPCGPETRQWEYFNGKCYYFSYEKTSWMQAKVQCEDRQSMLVIVNDMPEQNFLQTRTRNERYWIGLHDRDIEGHWRWIDGTSYFSGFTYWKQGEPNDDAHGEDCAHLWGNGEWNDVYCTYQCYYICEKPLPGARSEHQWRT
ncbi:hepatic lectin-like [Varanus komodoensis]|uniref:C-type lectin domain-containing protein n=1 Tax=Varanus komodoensis TaxID=61221 RepID=A0A8D2JJ87_VARKO|nr:hepatic lectin-like [Varanus komodoensis]